VTRASWLVATIVVAGLVPGGEAGAVRVERAWSPPGSTAAGARGGRVARWSDTAGVTRRGIGVARRAGDPGPIGIVHGPGGTRRVLRERETVGGERVLVQINRTRRMLDLVRGRAERCGSPEALDALQRASEMQERAEIAVRSGRRLGALQLTRGAREQGYAALRRCGDPGRSSTGAVSAIGRTDELLRVERQRLVERRDASGDGRLEALERAAAAQRRAHADFRDGRFESSLRRTEEARQSLRSEPRRVEPARPAARGPIERTVPERHDSPARRRPAGD